MIDPESLAKCGSEHAHQTAFFCWAANNRATYPELQFMYAVPNGGERNKIVAAQLIAEGVRGGVPDIFLPVSRHGLHGLYIEMKKLMYRTHKNGGMSDEQIKWKAALEARGYAVILCYSWTEARDTVISYLKG